jgi:hypothetical protein
MLSPQMGHEPKKSRHRKGRPMLAKELSVYLSFVHSAFFAAHSPLLAVHSAFFSEEHSAFLSAGHAEHFSPAKVVEPATISAIAATLSTFFMSCLLMG